MWFLCKDELWGISFLIMFFNWRSQDRQTDRCPVGTLARIHSRQFQTKLLAQRIAKICKLTPRMRLYFQGPAVPLCFIVDLESEPLHSGWLFAAKWLQLCAVVGGKANVFNRLPLMGFRKKVLKFLISIQVP